MFEAVNDDIELLKKTAKELEKRGYRITNICSDATDHRSIRHSEKKVVLGLGVEKIIPEDGKISIE